jgi:uncharacterized protein YjlB
VAQVQFGGDEGRTLIVSAVVGAYPGSGSFDQRRPGQIDHREALAQVAKVPAPPRIPSIAPMARW